MASLQEGIIFVQAKGFTVYHPSFPSGSHFSFSEKYIKDLDILEKAGLEDSISTWFVTLHIPLSNFIMILSDSVYFEKDIMQMDIQKQDEMTKAFLDTVPFENVLTKTFPIQNGAKVIAANKDFCDLMITAIRKQKYTIESVVPAVIFGIFGVPVDIKDDGLSDVAVSLLFRNYSQIKQQGFDIGQQVIAVSVNISQKNQSGKEKTNLPYLLVFFFVLIVVLIFVILSSRG